MKSLLKICLVVPFFVNALFMFAMIIAYVYKYGHITFADLFIFSVGILSILFGNLMNYLINKIYIKNEN